MLSSLIFETAVHYLIFGQPEAILQTDKEQHLLGYCNTYFIFCQPKCDEYNFKKY